MHPVIDRHRTRILAIAKRYGIREVRVFGSMARGDAGDGSDVDLLVTLPPEKRASLSADCSWTSKISCIAGWK